MRKDVLVTQTDDGLMGRIKKRTWQDGEIVLLPVSYTHLTLPTIYSV